MPEPISVIKLMVGTWNELEGLLLGFPLFLNSLMLLGLLGNYYPRTDVVLLPLTQVV